MEILKKIGIGLGILALAVLGYMGYLGAFKTVSVDEVDFPSTEIVLYLHKGPYKTLGNSWRSFDAAFKEAGGENCLGLALYFDPPSTPEDQLRSVLGCDLSKVPADKHAQLKSKFPSFVIPSSKSIHATFPFKNSISFMLAPMKVYSAMDKYLTGTGVMPSLAIETYGVYNQTEKIEFFMPKDLKRDAFDSVLNLFK